MRRKPGSLVPLERSICEAAFALRRTGVDEFHGYRIAKELAEAGDVRLLTAYGTLYRALGRLEKMGLLESRWEDPQIPARENRPGRRLYHLTAAGEAALVDARAADNPGRVAREGTKGWRQPESSPRPVRRRSDAPADASLDRPHNVSEAIRGS